MPAPDPAPTTAAPGRTLLFQQLELVLAEKRTSLSVVRTGIAVGALPLSILGLLVATSRFYAWAEVRNLLVPLLVICALLFLLAAYLVLRGLRQVHRHDRKIEALKRQDPLLGQLLD